MEIWKDIKGYELVYQVSNLWRIKSLRFWKEKILSLSNSNWYRQVCLFLIDRKTFYVHILVAEHFLVKTDNECEVNHKNWVRNDNILDNLEWCTHKQNIIHSYKLWRIWVWNSRNGWKKKILIKYSCNLDILEEYIWVSEYCKLNWYDQWFISRCCKTWAKWYWFYWWLK